MAAQQQAIESPEDGEEKREGAAQDHAPGGEKEPVLIPHHAIIPVPTIFTLGKGEEAQSFYNAAIIRL